MLAGQHCSYSTAPRLAFLPLGSALTLSVYLGGAGMGYLLLFMACVVTMTPPMALSREEREWDSRLGNGNPATKGLD